MSRTKKKSKGIGHEYWSKRPLSNKGGATPGKVTKKLTHRKERVQKKKIIKEAKEGL
jgi:hypothetical protein